MLQFPRALVPDGRLAGPQPDGGFVYRIDIGRGLIVYHQLDPAAYIFELETS